MSLRLEDLKGSAFIGTSELVDAARMILVGMGARQGKGTVKEFPDERTVRYYQSEGLIESPAEKQGTASVFRYRHLLALLVIKQLQAQHLPNKKIREIIDGRSEAELEVILAGGLPPRNAAQEYLEGLLVKPAPPDPPAFSRPMPRSSTPPPDNRHSHRSRAGQNWQRFEVLPGIELHVRKEAGPVSDPKRRMTFYNRIEEILRVLEEDQ